MGKSRKHLPLRRRLVINFRRRTNGLRKFAWTVRRFLTLEPHPEDIILRQEVERLLERKDWGYLPTWYIKKTLEAAMRGDRYRNG